MRRAVAYAAAVAVVLTAAFLLARRFDTLTPGLAAAYSTDAPTAARPPADSVDTPPLSSAMASHWRGSLPDAFSVTWTGQIWISSAGRYTLAVSADSGTSLFLDGQALFDNVRDPGAQYGAAARDLSIGAHTIFLTYAHRGGEARVDVLWARDGGPLTEVPLAALQPRRAGSLHVRYAQVMAAAPVYLGWIWAAIVVAVGLLIVAAAATRFRLALERAGMWREMRWILGASTLLNATAIWWGLPAAWVPIELTPTYTFDFVAHHFANGWYDAYPPLQYYVLAAAASPFLILQDVAGVTIDGVGGHALMMLVFRALSVLAAAGTVACAGLTANELFGRRAGLFAAAVFALTAPFVFYAKTANVDVPYIFWFAVSMLLFMRIVRYRRMRDFVMFAAAAAAAVCTKDQAYGFYVLVPLVVIVCLWREHTERGGIGRLVGVLLDRRVVAAAATAAVCFAAFHNLLFNLDGFRHHVAFITGPGSQDYRVYAPTLAGHAALLARTVRLVGESMSWPMFAAAVAGLLLALARRGTRALAIAAAVPIVSYYGFFIDVVLYNYDRFVIPMCFVLAAFAGFAFDRAIASPLPRRAVVAASAVVFAYALIYTATVDYLMVDDSRYAAARWMRSNVRDDIVAMSEPPELLPGLAGFRSIELHTIEELQREQPKFFVLNVDYARAAEPGSAWARLVAGIEQERLGYRAVARFRNRVPWQWLPLGHPDLVGPRQETTVFSVLRDINPTIEIYERADIPAPRQ